MTKKPPRIVVLFPQKAVIWILVGLVVLLALIGSSGVLYMTIQLERKVERLDEMAITEIWPP